jgi:O-antigen/teichoic acid export membrane protein
MSISLIPFSIVIYFAPSYMGLFFGTEWQPAAFSMIVMLCGALIGFNSNPIDKASVIVGAHRYMISWQVMRLIADAVPAGCAIAGWLGYESYLVMSVAGRSLLYVFDTVMGFVFASRVEPKATK